MRAEFDYLFTCKNHPLTNFSNFHKCGELESELWATNFHTLFFSIDLLQSCSACSKTITMTLGIFYHFSPCMHPKARYIRDITTPPFLRQKTLIKKPIKAATSNAGDLINWLCTKGGAYIFWGSRASLVLICKKQRFA
jgi:hypothetical protein